MSQPVVCATAAMDAIAATFAACENRERCWREEWNAELDTLSLQEQIRERNTAMPISVRAKYQVLELDGAAPDSERVLIKKVGTRPWDRDQRICLRNSVTKRIEELSSIGNQARLFLVYVFALVVSVHKWGTGPMRRLRYAAKESRIYLRSVCTDAKELANAWELEQRERKHTDGGD